MHSDLYYYVHCTIVYSIVYTTVYNNVYYYMQCTIMYTVPGPLFRAGGTPMPHDVPAPSPVNFRQEPKTENLLDDDQWGAFSSWVNQPHELIN